MTRSRLRLLFLFMVSLFPLVCTYSPIAPKFTIGTELQRQGCSARMFHTFLKASSDDHYEGCTSGPQPPPLGLTNTKRLFLVRHGQVVNPGVNRPVYYGAMDVPLSLHGQAEAKAAARYLEQFRLHRIVSSPLGRAVYGAEQIMSLQEDTGLEIVTMDGLKELDRGSWCGMTKGEIGVDLVTRFHACDETVTPMGGETLRTLKNRVRKARDTLLDELMPGETAAIVSHLHVTRSLISDALGVPTSEMVNVKVDTASISCIDYNADTGLQTVHFQSYKPETKP